MPLDYAVGILDHRLNWQDEAAASEGAADDAAAAASSTVPDEPSSPESAVCEAEASPQETAPPPSKEVREACLHPEFHKLNQGLNAIVNAALQPSSRFLKSAVEKLKLKMTDARATEELKEAKDTALDVFSTSFDADDKLQAIKVALVSQILIFLNISMEDYGLQEKLRAIQTTRRSCLLLLKKLNQIKAVRQNILQHLEDEKVATSPQEEQREQNQEQQRPASESDPSTSSIRLNEVFAMNLQTSAFLRLIHQKILHDAVEGSDTFASTSRENSEAAIIGEIVGVGGGVEAAPTMRLRRPSEEGAEDVSVVSIMGRVFRRTKDEDLRTLLEFEVEELVDGFCATGDPAYWQLAKEACDAIDVSIRRKAMKKVHPRLVELMERLYETGEMHFLKRVLNIAQVTGFSPPIDKDDLAHIQKIINRKFDLFDDIKDPKLLKDIASFVSALGFIQLLETSRRECSVVAKAADAALCTASSKTAPDLDAANAFNERSVYPWISAKVNARVGEGGVAGIVDEWLQRSFDSPKAISFVALKAPSLQECAPTVFSLLGTDDAAAAAQDVIGDADAWTKLLEASTSGWKGGDWRAFAVDKLGTFKHWRIAIKENAKGEKVSIKNVKLFL